MDLGLEGAGAQEFFDELSEDDHMPGVEEAEEAKDGKKKKATAAKKKTVSNRVTLNENRVTGKQGLVKYLSYFQNMNLSKEKNSEYANLQILMSRLERWSHDLYPKFTLDATLQKIESMGTKSLVRNTIKRIRLNELNEQLDNENDDSVRRGDVAQSAEAAFDDLAQLDEMIESNRKRALSDPESGESHNPPKKTLTDEQKARMEENKRKALEKKRAREMEALEKAAEEARQREEDELLADFDM
ncbi:Oidioi.mRNA.OKI2018_I69.PAR.g10521.t1.cds [Oikopleura dioica]|uniref:TIMELESS-interacting protein n=1 Tax=Oikopleura dioica TaxID=34765 RepID=A0ABN7RUK1_OIKDI|nr:Oidioi.mRNA.OKI2018_I69.PAR.g10521.t1.cds [Oikopleura dioica]